MRTLMSLLILAVAISVSAQPMDDVVARNILTERKAMEYPPIREGDIFWQKRIWRIIDVREKMNQPFVCPEAPLFDLMTKAATEGEINLYSAEDEKFSFQLSETEINDILVQTDTVEIYDPGTHEPRYEVVETRLFYENVKRFRLKEIWFFDENTSSLNVRILGIAPLIEVRDDYGNFKYERALFWAYYPELRQVLANVPFFIEGNDSHAISWGDVFERRQFSSTIIKGTNVLDLRIQDSYTGLDALWEAEKIREELFNFEHDLWEY